MILIIDNYDSFTYNLYQSIASQIGAEKTRVIRNDKIAMNEIKQLSPNGIILSPGPGRPESAGLCVPLIKALTDNEFAHTIPLLGVCLGHQALAVALNGKVIQAPEICHGKQDVVYHEQVGLYKKLPRTFQAGRYHSLIVDRETLPTDLIIDAENSAGLIMGMHHTTLPLFGVQFHPESILTPSGDQLLKAFLEECHLTKRGQAA